MSESKQVPIVWPVILCAIMAYSAYTGGHSAYTAGYYFKKSFSVPVAHRLLGLSGLYDEVFYRSIDILLFSICICFVSLYKFSRAVSGEDQKETEQKTESELKTEFIIGLIISWTLILVFGFYFLYLCTISIPDTFAEHLLGVSELFETIRNQFITLRILTVIAFFGGLVKLINTINKYNTKSGH